MGSIPECNVKRGQGLLQGWSFTGGSADGILVVQVRECVWGFGCTCMIMCIL